MIGRCRRITPSVDTLMAIPAILAAAPPYITRTAQVADLGTGAAFRRSETLAVTIFITRPSDAIRVPEIPADNRTATLPTRAAGVTIAVRNKPGTPRCPHTPL